MKLSDALEHQKRIQHMAKELNKAINDAVADGLSVELDTIQNLNLFGETTNIEINVKVNPQDID